MCARRINPGIWLDDLVTTPLKQRTFRSKFPSQNCAEILTTSCEQAVREADHVSHRVRYRIIPDGGEINSAVSPSEEKKKGFSGNRITQSPLLSSRKKCPLPAEFIKICERFPLVNFAAMAPRGQAFERSKKVSVSHPDVSLYVFFSLGYRRALNDLSFIVFISRLFVACKQAFRLFFDFCYCFTF